MTDIDLNADCIDVRDIIERVEELRSERDSDDRDELQSLESILDNLRGNGGDEQWEGDWYPTTLIRDSYFEDAMDELLEDIGDIPRDLPSYLTIEVDYLALQMDYTSTEINGVTYWYR